MHLVMYGHPGIQVAQTDNAAEAAEMAGHFTASTPYKHYVKEGEGLTLQPADDTLYIDVKDLLKGA